MPGVRDDLPVSVAVEKVDGRSVVVTSDGYGREVGDLDTVHDVARLAGWLRGRQSGELQDTGTTLQGFRWPLHRSTSCLGLSRGLHGERNENRQEPSSLLD